MDEADYLIDNSIEIVTAKDIWENDICAFLTYFSHNTYSVVHPKEEPVPYMSVALKLMEKDYIVVKIDNKDGLLCPQYPEIIPIMESPRKVTTIYENEEETQPDNIDVTEITNLWQSGNLARCRLRFPVPVILFNGKHICRSSTLSGEPEVCVRTGLTKISGSELIHGLKECWWPTEGLGPYPEIEEDESEGPVPCDNDVRAQRICDRVRSFDIKLLKRLNVNTIVDIMVEKRKVKHSIYVSASEKVDLNRYSSFKVINLPYPGCEFFKEFHDAMYSPAGLLYKWDDPANDAVLSLPNDGIERNIAINWEQYKEWDLVLITQNYMKYILRRLQEDTSGLLLHCISGWDRTPLFMSLIRLSLWADSLIHQSLTEHEILYFTLVYDWYLFGHHLANRLYKNEEIMAFCFDFLKYIVGDEYSLKSSKKKHSEEMKVDESRSPSRSSNSSVCADDNTSIKRKKNLSNDFLMAGGSENSNDSTMTMEFPFEDSNSPPDASTIDHSNPVEGGKVVFDDVLMDQCGDDLSKPKVLSPTSLQHKRTSPIPVATVNPSRRQRSESTSSTASTKSWQFITESGSVEKDTTYKPPRQQRLEAVRSLFNSFYQKTVKNDSFGPPSKWIFEDIVGNVTQMARWLDMPQVFASGDVGTNGNIEQDLQMEVPDPIAETNGNNDQIGENEKIDDVDNSNK
ncbi:myotubularin-related protein 14 [Euwallacea similis]|uniref:myotubularin-related protein 14 n=1 Tax=Euwallacea similis TaxID=1736056 RepID=UPI00344B61D5